MNMSASEGWLKRILDALTGGISISGLPTTGQKTMANSSPVTMANDQSTIDTLDQSCELQRVGAHSDGTNIAAAVTLTPPVGATRILIQAVTQNIRWTIDGTVPTANIGFQLSTTFGPVVLQLGSNAVLKVIQEAATADLEYQWLE